MADNKTFFDPSGFSPKHARLVLTEQDAGDFDEAQRNLLRAFVWDESPEGHIFWRQVYDDLREGQPLAEGAHEALLRHINSAEAEQEVTTS